MPKHFIIILIFTILSLNFALQVEWDSLTSSLKPAENFDITRISGVTYYEQVFFDNNTLPFAACSVYQFTVSQAKSQNTPAVYFQLAYQDNRIGAEYGLETDLLNQSPKSSATFTPQDTFTKGSLVILDYAPNYEWIVFINTFSYNEFITTVSRDLYNPKAIQKGIDIALKYNLKSAHTVTQDARRCGYLGAFDSWKRARQ